MNKTVLQANEYNDYYQRYIDGVNPSHDLIEALQEGQKEVISYFNAIPDDKLDYRYESDKWSIKEVLQHMIDTERIFMYRCLRIARNDSTPLAGFDQNNYIDPSGAEDKTREQLVDEYSKNRENSIALLQGIPIEHLSFVGTASDSSLSARAAAFIVVGHDKWHLKIIEERYL